MEELGPGPQILTPCGSARRRSIGVSNSPEFEFCNHIPQSADFVCAAELFSGGVLLPLRRLRPSDESPPPAPAPDPEPLLSDRRPPEPEVIHTAQLSASSINNAISLSMRWRDIFRKNDKKGPRRSMDFDAEKDINSSFREMKKREMRNSTVGGGGVTAAELNINIWPFSRSRSYGNGPYRPRSAAPAAARNVSSAPCSRSNSTGESKSKRLPGSPRKGGVHLGRTSPVGQVHRGGSGGRQNKDAVFRKILLPDSFGDGCSKAKVLDLNMPTCIGYRQNLSCKSEGSSAGGGGESISGEGVLGSSLSKIKSFFTKKVH